MQLPLMCPNCGADLSRRTALLYVLDDPSLDAPQVTGHRDLGGFPSHPSPVVSMAAGTPMQCADCGQDLGKTREDYEPVRTPVDTAALLALLNAVEAAVEARDLLALVVQGEQPDDVLWNLAELFRARAGRPEDWSQGKE